MKKIEETIEIEWPCEGEIRTTEISRPVTSISIEDTIYEEWRTYSE